MGKVKKNFFIIFLVLVLSVNFASAGEKFYSQAIFSTTFYTPAIALINNNTISFHNPTYNDAGADTIKLINGGVVNKIQFTQNYFYIGGNLTYWQYYIVNNKVHLWLYDQTSQQPLLDFGWVNIDYVSPLYTYYYRWFSPGSYQYEGPTNAILSLITLPTTNWDIPNVYFPANHNLSWVLQNPVSQIFLKASVYYPFPSNINATNWNGDLSVFIKFIGQVVYGLDLIKPPYGNQNYYWDVNDASNNTINTNIYTDSIYNNLNDVDIGIYDYQTNQLIWGYNKFIGRTIAQVQQSFDFSNENLNNIIKNATSTSIFKLVFTAHLYDNTLQNKIDLTDYSIFYVLGKPIIKFLYSDWYNNIIGNFGLSGATPTPLFIKAGENLDNTFQTFQSFITIDNDKLNNLKTSVINNLNTFIGYINGFTNALGFLKYLFYGLLVFTMIEFIVKFGRLIIPFK